MCEFDGPEEIEECWNCDGGYVYTPMIASRWSDDPYPERVDTCPVCGGRPFSIVPARPDGYSEAEIERSQSFLAMLLGEDL